MRSRMRQARHQQTGQRLDRHTLFSWCEGPMMHTNSGSTSSHMKPCINPYRLFSDNTLKSGYAEPSGRLHDAEEHLWPGQLRGSDGVHAYGDRTAVVGNQRTTKYVCTESCSS